MDARTSASIKKLTDALNLSIEGGLETIGKRITMDIRRNLMRAGTGELYRSKRARSSIISGATIFSTHGVGTSSATRYRIVKGNTVEWLAVRKAKNAGYYLRGIKHRASKPGFPPAPDTETLRNSISFSITQGGGYRRLNISSDAPYAKYMEVGTHKVLARPFMRPSIYKYIKLLGPEIAKQFKFNYSGRLANEFFKDFIKLDKIEAITRKSYFSSR